MPGAFQSPRTQRAALLLRLLPDESSRVPRRGGGVSPGLRRAGPCRLRAAAARAGLDASTCGFDNARTEPRLAEQAVALTPRIGPHCTAGHAPLARRLMQPTAGSR